MPVTVRTKRPAADGGLLSVTHEEAGDFRLLDGGHLAVTAWRSGREEGVAVYAPGQWIDAVVQNGADR